MFPPSEPKLWIPNTLDEVSFQLPIAVPFVGLLGVQSAPVAGILYHATKPFVAGCGADAGVIVGVVVGVCVGVTEVVGVLV